MTSAAANQPIAPADAEPLVLSARPHHAVALLTLNRPAARNALSVAMIEALHVAIAQLGADATVSAIVLAAKGPVF